MSAIRKPGRLNDNTTLVDIGMLGIYGVTAVYLVRGEKTCLIDAGTYADAPRLAKMLRELGAFPPDYIVVTHPHWDHAQGIPRLRREASAQNIKIEVLASHQAIPLLADPTFNDPFGDGPYESIQDVTAVKEGDTLALGGVTLRFYEIPGHCQGHIAILDQENRNIFVGDALGDKLRDQIFLPPFMPPTWDPDAYLASVNRLKHIDYQTLCLAHFGCILGDEARSILDESIETCNTWWQFYERNADRLSDTGYMLQAMRKEIRLAIPDPEPISSGLKAMLRLAIGAATVLGKETPLLDKLAFSDYHRWLATGYQTYKSAR